MMNACGYLIDGTLQASAFLLSMIRVHKQAHTSFEDFMYGLAVLFFFIRFNYFKSQPNLEYYLHLSTFQISPNRNF